RKPRRTIPAQLLGHQGLSPFLNARTASEAPVFQGKAAGQKGVEGFQRKKRAKGLLNAPAISRQGKSICPAQSLIFLSML
ncbi:hypothetical protein, partial [Sphingorhabdus sp.]|uniref:hypothetical protein n=1 Tax=Sphingorhabdus sp. TaxID=1902408 RepID=UPI003BB08094